MSVPRLEAPRPQSAPPKTPLRPAPPTGNATSADDAARSRDARSRDAGGRDHRPDGHERPARRRGDERLALVKSLPFFFVHGVALATPFVLGLSWEGVAWVAGLYLLRMFAITAGYHRYFAHRSFKTSRAFQFVLAVLGTTATQKGPLWWAGHHRHHHRYSDQPEDVHSPKRGFWWSHVGWILATRYDETPTHRIKDFAKFPELVWLDRHFLVPPVALGAVLFLVGGWTALLWGFFVSTVVLWHGTFAINSLAHIFGRRRYETTDTSRNSMLLALLTLGEGWHNNHHHFPSTANQGWFWWEVDVSWYVLRALSAVGVVWDLRTPPEHVRRPEVAPALTRDRGPAETGAAGA